MEDKRRLDAPLLAEVLAKGLPLADNKVSFSNMAMPMHINLLVVAFGILYVMLTTIDPKTYHSVSSFWFLTGALGVQGFWHLVIMSVKIYSVVATKKYSSSLYFFSFGGDTVTSAAVIAACCNFGYHRYY